MFLLIHVFRKQRFVDNDGFFPTNNGDARNFTGGKGIRHLLFCRLRNQRVGAELLVDSFQARSQIHGVSDHGIIKPGVRPHVAHHGISCIDADAHFQILPQALTKRGTHLGKLCLAAKGRPDTTDGMIGLCQRCIPEGNNGVSLILVHRTPLLMNNIGHGSKVDV